MKLDSTLYSYPLTKEEFYHYFNTCNYENSVYLKQLGFNDITLFAFDNNKNLIKPIKSDFFDEVSDLIKAPSCRQALEYLLVNHPIRISDIEYLNEKIIYSYQSIIPVLSCEISFNNKIYTTDDNHILMILIHKILNKPDPDNLICEIC